MSSPYEQKLVRAKLERNRKIFAVYESGTMSLKNIGREFGISANRVREICQREQRERDYERRRAR